MSATPPRALEPILARIERVDRWRRRIRPLRAGGLLGMELRRHRGVAIRLADGSVIARGALVGEIHLDNAVVAAIAARGWRAAFDLARRDLVALAAWTAERPPSARPVAYRADGLVAPLTARLGFEVRPARGGPYAALQAWYLRGILVRWARGGRTRLAIGHPRQVRAAWLSQPALEARYGTAGPDGSLVPGEGLSPDPPPGPAAGR